MTEIVLTKAATGALVPVDPVGAEYVANLKLGASVKAKISRQRNPKFHRKLFALLHVGFDAWEPNEPIYKGMVVQKNFEQFRNDVVVLAGFYESTITLKGDIRLTAKSLSFATMDQDEFDKLYNAVINVLLQRILKNYTREDLDRVVEQVLAFT